MGEVDRRDFLKGSRLGGATAVAPSGRTRSRRATAASMAREPTKRLPDAVGMLYDSTLCIGCKACVAACKPANEMPPETPPSLLAWNEHTWDTPRTCPAAPSTSSRSIANGTARGEGPREGRLRLRQAALPALRRSVLRLGLPGAAP